MLFHASVGLVSLLQLSNSVFALPTEQERLGTQIPKDVQTVRAECAPPVSLEIAYANKLQTQESRNHTHR
jgi:hypothetical protein